MTDEFGAGVPAQPDRATNQYGIDEAARSALRKLPMFAGLAPTQSERAYEKARDEYNKRTGFRPVIDPARRGYYGAGETIHTIGGVINAKDLERTRNFAKALDAGDRESIIKQQGKAGRMAARLGFDISKFRDDPGYRSAVIKALEGNVFSQAKQAAQAGTKRAAIPQAYSVSQAFKGDAGNFLDTLARDPVSLIGNILIEQLPAQAPGLAAAPFTMGGSVAVNSFAVEYAAELRTTLAESGVDINNPNALAAALTNRDLMEKVKTRAAAKGLPIAVLDAISVGIASKLLLPAKAAAGMTPLGRTAANISAQIPAQGALGGAGEALGQYAAYGEVKSWPEVLAEVVVEFGQGPIEVGAMALRKGAQGTKKGSAGPAGPGGTTQGPSPQPATAGPLTGSGESSAGAGGNVAITPKGTRVEYRPEVVEAGSLVSSHTGGGDPNPSFPAELQPRERGRAASRTQIVDIAANLRPELLGLTGSATDGAPIIGPDGVVESGNARVLAIMRAYQENMPGAQAYRGYLKSQGYSVEGMKAPVLIRRRTTNLTPEQRRAFTRETNERTTLAQSASERAKADAERLSPDVLSLLGGANPLTARKFVQAFLDGVPASERGSLVTAQGVLSQEGLARIENALFARAYGDAELLASLREDADTNIRAIGAALIEVAPIYARLKADIEAGRIRAEMDITAALLEAARVVSDARRRGINLRDLIAQQDAFGGISPMAERVLRLLFRDDGFARPASRQSIAAALRFYIEQAGKAQAGPALDLGGPQATAEGILDLARTRGTGDMFGEAAEMQLPDTARSGLPGTRPRLPIKSVIARNQARAGTQGRLLSIDQVEAEGALPDTAAMSGPAGPPLLSVEEVEAQGALPETAEMTPGANYTPLVRDKVGGEKRAKPLRREDILRPLLADLGVPIYQGRIRGKGTLGFYRRKIEEVRIKRMSDIEVAAHEIAHLLDDRFPEIRAQWLPASNANKTIRDELRGVSYDQTKLYEGFAEFVRLWATQEDMAKAHAPNFYDWFENWIEGNEHGPAIRRAQRQMHDWFAQEGVTRARSKIGKVKGINEGVDPIWSRFRQWALDDFHGIERMERELAGDIAPGGAYEVSRLTRAAHSIVEGALLYGAPVVNPDGSHSFKGKGLEQILAPVNAQLDDFLMYAVGRSAAELKAQGRERLFTAAEIKAMVGLETPAFKKAFDEYQRWNSAILDFAQAKHLINKDARSKWRRAAYIPFHRVGQPAGAHQPVQGDWRGIKALTGGTDNLRDIMGNIIGNASMVIQAALINEARLEVANLAREAGGGRFMVRIPTDEKVVKIHRAEVERAILAALGVKDFRALPVEVQMVLEAVVSGFDVFVPFTTRGHAPAGNNVTAVLRYGKPEYYEVGDPLLFRALSAFNRPTQNWLLKLLGGVRRLGQMSVTLSFDFMAANIVRDTLMGSVMTRHGFKPFVDTARGLKSRVASDKSYLDFIANGGGFSSYYVDEASFRKHLDKFYRSKGIDPRMVMYAPAKTLFALERFGDAFEQATRIGEFKRATKAGVNPRHAAYLAREISTDFAMRGDSRVLGFLYDSVMFLKAGINGIDRSYRGFTKDPNRRAIMAKTAIIAAISAGLYAVNRGNELYEELEDWDKDTHWHFFIPRPETIEAWGDGRDLPPIRERYWHFRMPKLWEIGAAASIAERTVEGVLDREPVKAGKNIVRVIRDQFRLDPIPQAVKPIYELATNRIGFIDRPIETLGMKSLQPWARSSPYGSRALAKLGEATRGLPRELQISPAQAEALVRGYLNTWGMYGLTLTDAMFFDDLPDLRFDQYPVVRRFYRQQPPRSTKWMTKFYDALREATEARRTMRHMDKLNRPGVAGEIESTPSNLEYNHLSRASQKMRAIRREMVQVVAAKNLAGLRDYAERLTADRKLADTIYRMRNRAAWNDLGALKRELLDMWTERRNGLAEQVVRNIEAERRKGRHAKRRLPMAKLP